MRSQEDADRDPKDLLTVIAAIGDPEETGDHAIRKVLDRKDQGNSEIFGAMSLKVAWLPRLETTDRNVAVPVRGLK